MAGCQFRNSYRQILIGNQLIGGLISIESPLVDSRFQISFQSLEVAQLIRRQEFQAQIGENRRCDGSIEQ